jgi:hypothetical protein
MSTILHLVLIWELAVRREGSIWCHGSIPIIMVFVCRWVVRCCSDRAFDELHLPPSILEVCLIFGPVDAALLEGFVSVDPEQAFRDAKALISNPDHVVVTQPWDLHVPSPEFEQVTLRTVEYEVVLLSVAVGCKKRNNVRVAVGPAELFQDLPFSFERLLVVNDQLLDRKASVVVGLSVKLMMCWVHRDHDDSSIATLTSCVIIFRLIPGHKG